MFENNVDSFRPTGLPGDDFGYALRSHRWTLRRPSGIGSDEIGWEDVLLDGTPRGTAVDIAPSTQP